MTREALLEMTRREVDNLQNDRIDLAPDVYKIPTASYHDPERYKLEVERIFKRLPLALGFSCELKEPGDYRAMTVAGVPVLMTRANDGQAHAFVNACSHRGNYVVQDGAGSQKDFRCGYHAWVYDLQGDLINVFDEDNFGDIDKSCNGLTPLPVAERGGMIWVTLNPNSKVDIDDFLSGYDVMMDHLRFNDTYIGGRQELHGPNWKVAYDGYRDFYHLPILHRDSFGPNGSHQPDYYAWGPHVRVSSPKGHEIFADRPEDEWHRSARQSSHGDSRTWLIAETDTEAVGLVQGRKRRPGTLLLFAAIFAGLGTTRAAGRYDATAFLVLGVLVGSGLWWVVMSNGVNRFSALILLGFAGFVLLGLR